MGNAAASSAAVPSATSRPPQRTMSTNSMELVRGTHQFSIADYSLRKGIGIGNFIRSGIFEVGGYSWTIRCYPVGEATESEGYVSLFLELMSSSTATEKVPVEYSFKICGPGGLFHQSVLLTNDFTSENEAWGRDKFIKIEYLESQYVMNDCLTISCIFEVQKESKTGPSRRHFIDVPPSSVCQDLARLLENKQGSDVTVHVGSNKYAAHRAVLAMRSPVFNAQFFGPMAEDNTGDDSRVLRIHDMEPAVFEAVLHFLYTDSLPPVDSAKLVQTAAGCSGHESHREKVHDWLAAADRYGLDRMRLLCENALCESIDVENAAATLVLADRHHCPQLKSFCVEYIASSGLLRAVQSTEGYKELKLNCPSLLAEVMEKIESGSCVTPMSLAPTTPGSWRSKRIHRPVVRDQWQF